MEGRNGKLAVVAMLGQSHYAADNSRPSLQASNPARSHTRTRKDAQ
jgi:hypothetical protein